MTDTLRSRVIRITATALLGSALPLAACSATTHDTPAGHPAVPAVAHHIQEDDPDWNCQTMGDRVCRHVLGSWTELKPGTGLPPERLYGYIDGAAPGSVDFVYDER